MVMAFLPGGILGIYKSIQIHSSSFPLDETFQAPKKNENPKRLYLEAIQALRPSRHRNEALTTSAQMAPTRTNPPYHAAATVFNFSCSAAKFRFIALSVN